MANFEFDFKGAKANGNTDEDIAKYVADKTGFDLAGAEKSGNTYGDIVSHMQKYVAQTPEPAKPAPKSRGWGEAALDTVKDFGIGLAKGGAGFAEGIGTLGSLATTGDMDNPLITYGKKASNYLQGQKSDYLKGLEQTQREEIDNADGILGKAGAALSTTLTSPALAANMVAENVVNLLPTAWAGRGAQAVTLAHGATAAKAAGVGVGAAVGTGAAQQGSDVSKDVYDEAMAKPDSAWIQNKEFMTQVAATDKSEKAINDLKHEYALKAARAAFLPASAATVGTSLLPGGRAIERAIVGGGVKGGGSKFWSTATAKKTGLAMAGEGLISEGPEEALGKIAGNEALRHYVDKNQDWKTGVGESYGRGAAGGILMGGSATLYRQAQDARQAKIDKLKEAGEVDTAEALQKRHDAQTASENTEVELSKIGSTTPAFNEFYKGLRANGAKPVDASARSALLDSFTDVAKASGMSQKLMDAAIEQAKTQPLDQVPASFQKFLSAAISERFAQPFDGHDTVGEKLSTIRDEAIDGAINTFYSENKLANDIVDLEKSQEFSQATPVEDSQPAHVMTQAAPVELKTGRILQNRDRSTPQSIKQMQGIAANPDFLRAGISSNMQDGAPVVFEENNQVPDSAVIGRETSIVDGEGKRYSVNYAVVRGDDVLASNDPDGTPNAEYEAGDGKLRAVAGNGRLAGIKLGHEMGTTSSYMTDMRDNLEQLGIDPSAVEHIERPVLVRLMTSDQVPDNIGQVSNIASTAALNPVEQAAQDAAGLDVQALQFSEHGVTPSSVMGWMSSLPNSEGSGLTSNGEISGQAIKRLNAALFYKAYGSEELVQLYTEATDPDAKRILTAIGNVAPLMAQLEGAEDYDVRGAVVEAANLAVNAARLGEKLADHIKTEDFMVSDEARVVAGLFAKNINSAQRLTKELSEFANEVLDAVRTVEENKSQAGFFDEKPVKTRQQLFEGLNNANPTNAATAEIGDKPSAGSVDAVADRQDPNARDGQDQQANEPAPTAKPEREVKQVNDLATLRSLTIGDVPADFVSGYTVKMDVYSNQEKAMIKVEMPASEALDALNKEVQTLDDVMKCVKG